MTFSQSRAGPRRCASHTRSGASAAHFARKAGTCFSYGFSLWFDCSTIVPSAAPVDLDVAAQEIDRLEGRLHHAVQRRFSGYAVSVGVDLGTSMAAGQGSFPAAWRIGWLQLVVGVVCMVMIANLQYGWTLFVQPIDAKYGWGRAAIQVAFSIFVITEAWLVPIEGWFVDQFGPRHRRGRWAACWSASPGW